MWREAELRSCQKVAKYPKSAAATVGQQKPSIDRRQSGAARARCHSAERQRVSMVEEEEEGRSSTVEGGGKLESLGTGHTKTTRRTILCAGGRRIKNHNRLPLARPAARPRDSHGHLNAFSLFIRATTTTMNVSATLEAD